MTDNDRPAIPAAHFSAAIGTLSVLVSVASYILVLWGGMDEPYAEFNPSDALSQIGLGSLFIGIWGFIIAAVFYGVLTRRLSRWWFLLIVWAIIVISYLEQCPFGYVQDIMAVSSG